MSAKIPPKPSKDVIYVDVDDEITSIIDKIENADHKVVALVLPKRAASLQSIVNMKLLKRSADTAGKNPVLITSEAALLPLAGAAGLHVAKNLQSKPEVPEAPVGAVAMRASDDLPAEELPETDETMDEDNMPAKIDYEQSIGALAAAHEVENPETIALDDEDEADKPVAKAAKAPKDKKNKVPNFDRFRMLLGLGILAFVGLIVFIILALFVLPKATITIQTSSEPLSANFNLAASAATTTLDSAKSAIPAKLEISDQTGSQSVTATGSQNNGAKATGSIKITNCSSDVYSVSSGSGFTSGAYSFISQTAANVPKSSYSLTPGGFVCDNNGTASVSVKAQNPGTSYNLSARSYNIPGSPTNVTATGSDMAGGTDSIVTILSQSDVDGAKQKLTTGTTGSDFTKALEKKLSDAGEYVLGNTLKAGDPVITASPAVGQPASTSNVTIKITYTVLTIKKTDLSQAIQDKLSSQIDKTKQKLNGNFLNDASVTVQSQASPTTATLTINEDTTAVPIINIASVKKQAEGKKVGDIKAAIGNWAGVKSVDVKLSPFWVSKVPKKDGKVKVIIQEVKTSSSSSGQP